MQAEQHLAFTDRTGWTPRDVYDMTLLATGDQQQARAARMEYYRQQLDRRLA